MSGVGHFIRFKDLWKFTDVFMKHKVGMTFFDIMVQEKTPRDTSEIYILIVLEELQFQNLYKESKLRALSLIHSAKNVLDDLITTLGAGLDPMA
jgi:hypothetical protein